MTLNRFCTKVKFTFNKRKHIKEYPFVSMVILHHFFIVFGIDIKTLDEENILPPEDATVEEALPVYVYNAIYSDATYLKSIEVIEANIKQLYKEKNEWCLWLINNYYNQVALDKAALQEMALLSHDSMAKDYIKWELKVNMLVAELIDQIDIQLNSQTERNQNKRRNKKKR